MSFWLSVKNVIAKYFFNTTWRCNACGKEIFDGEYFCEDCLKTLPVNDGYICAHCGRATIQPEEYCSTCKDKLTAIDRGRSAFEYKPPISAMIKKVKYYNRRYHVEYFAERLKQVYLQNYFNADFILGVPMTKKAKRKRGFNQSELLAESVAKMLSIPIYSGLAKVKDTKRQAKLTRKERVLNLSGTFKVVDKNTIKDKSLVVIDDVTTTGSTLQIIAETLKKAGAKQVFAITVASVAPIDKY